MDIVGWLLDSDPAIRWQVLRDVVRAPAAAVAAERARVATEGWGARLLALQAADGSWGGRTFSRDWICTFRTMTLLRVFGLDPESAAAQRAVARVRAGVTWGAEFDDHPFFAGEVEPCINGQALAAGAYFGVLDAPLLERLLGEQLDDGGWNCEAPPSQVSSFHTTICVLEGLLAYEEACGGAPEIAAARGRGHDYLLARGLLRRRSTGELIDAGWLRFAFPPRWHYDVLRGLDHLRAAGVAPDARVAEAVAMVAGRRDADGRWPLDDPHPCAGHFEMEAAGAPSRWNTLRALRVLEWARG